MKQYSLRNDSQPAAIPALDFINLDPLDINPLISKCEIKVMYLGTNRNGSYISKDTAIEMSKTLRGTPIVAAWYEEENDFGDHGDVLHIENGEATFSCATVPYGFVDPQAPVWFENFVDTDEFGNSVERTYMLTTGYLWTGQYPEITSVITEGKGQSMELDEENLDGQWTENYDFFIINEASFSKLCILGDSVEPCFEGAAVTSPRTNYDFDKNKAFIETLFSMREELNNALQNRGGSMLDEEKTQFSEEVSSDAPAETTETAAEAVVEEQGAEEEVLETEEATEEVGEPQVEELEPAPAVEEEVEKAEAAEPEADPIPEEEEDKKVVDDVFGDGVIRRILGLHSLQDAEALAVELETLRAENAALKAFKLETERSKKQELMQKFVMLENEEEYSTLAANLDSYSLGELESKLCVLYVHTTAELNSIGAEIETQTEESDPITTFNLDQTAENVGPGFLSALRRTNH